MSNNALTTDVQDGTISRPQPVTTGFVAPLLPQTAKALAEAQQKSQPVPHDQTNAYHKYDYTSAEAIIAEAKKILGSCGLSLLPLEQTVNGHDREGPDRFELVRKFLLLHSSGESVPVVLVWPIIPDKGRPLDKATGAAATTSLAYFLRDLLLMPRVDKSDDVGSREDRPREQPRARPAPAQKPPEQQPAGLPPGYDPHRDPAEVIGAEQVADLETLLTAKAKRWDDARKWLQDQPGADIDPQAQTADLSWLQYMALRDVLLAPPRKKKVG